MFNRKEIVQMYHTWIETYFIQLVLNSPKTIWNFVVYVLSTKHRRILFAGMLKILICTKT